jgi:hypothetical protein
MANFKITLEGAQSDGVEVRAAACVERDQDYGDVEECPVIAESFRRFFGSFALFKMAMAMHAIIEYKGRRDCWIESHKRLWDSLESFLDDESGETDGNRVGERHAEKS